MTAKEDIQGWFYRGVADGRKWLIVVCDSFSHEDYPVFADTVSDFDQKYAKYNGDNMQRIMEVYDLSKDLYIQLKKSRTREYPEKSRYNPAKPKDDNAVLKWLG